MGFQTQVNTQPAVAVQGDFASANPRFTVLAGAGALIAGALGVTIGNFAWIVPPVDDVNAPAIVNSFGVGAVAGFVHRAQQGLNTTFLSESAMTMPKGFPVTLMSGGDFFMKNSGSGQALVGMKAYANFADGSIQFAATGAPPTASATGSIAAETFSVTGGITGSVLTVTAVGSGTVVPGATISGTGVTTGTEIVSQLSGTAGGIGTYAVSMPEQSVAAGTTISGTYGLFTAASALVGTFVVGGLLSGTSVVAGTAITALGTGAGGLGTYIVNNNTVVSSTTITETTAVETKWIAMSAGAAGELVKCSDHALG